MWLIPLFACLNLLGGRGFENKVVEFLRGKYFTRGLYMGVAAGLYQYDYITGIIVALGCALWAAPGWGKYFMAIHGQDKLAEKEVGWIDSLTSKIIKSPKNKKQRRLWGAVAMSLRGLYILPMFIALAVYLQNPYAALLGLGCALIQGVVYWLVGIKHTKKSVVYAEVIYGAIIGTSVWVSLW